MTNPSREAVDLSATLGTWEGDEVLHPGPGNSDEIEGRGRLVVRSVLEGRGTSGEYVHTRDGEVSVVAHIVVIPSSRDEEDVSMHWMSAVEKTVVYRGRFRDGMFRLRAEANGVHMRIEQDFSKPGLLSTASYMGADPNDLTLVFEGSYRRVAASKLGTIGWRDLTVDDAPRVRDFYAKVCGWTHDAVSMGAYDDFNMIAADGEVIAGVCHARGPNADIPPAWVQYVYVADLDQSLQAVQVEGGRVVAGPKAHGASRYAIVTDPAGATIGLFQEG